MDQWEQLAQDLIGKPEPASERYCVMSDEMKTYLEAWYEKQMVLKEGGGEGKRDEVLIFGLKVLLYLSVGMMGGLIACRFLM